jgi:hypothetical protein
MAQTYGRTEGQVITPPPIEQDARPAHQKITEDKQDTKRNMSETQEHRRVREHRISKTRNVKYKQNKRHISA